MRILGVLHPGGGHTGLLSEQARRVGHELLEWHPADEAERPAGADAIAVFGGGMNVADAAELPWLRTEIAMLRDALEDGTPVLGVCLGSQLLAAAAGADVRRAVRPEIGWFAVERTDAGADDPVLGALPARFTAYQWHSWTFTLPDGAEELARSPVCPQAYSLGARAWGVQCHPEVTPDILDAWIADAGSDPDAVAQGYAAVARIGLAERLTEWNALGRVLFDGWLDAAERLTSPARAAPPAQRPAAGAAPDPRRPPC
jgi:GMP synthase (glutamine-hydrolysing)